MTSSGMSIAMRLAERRILILALPGGARLYQGCALLVSHQADLVRQSADAEFRAVLLLVAARWLQAQPEPLLIRGLASGGMQAGCGGFAQPVPATICSSLVRPLPLLSIWSIFSLDQGRLRVENQRIR